MPEGRVRIGVVGVGHLGRAHARILAELPGAHLVGVADLREERAREVGERLGVPWTTDFRRLPGEPRAACVVVPTSAHFAVASHLLEAGVHVLVEKPMAMSLAEADRLVELAAAGSLVLQVGHVERFNPIMAAVREMGIRPRYIEANRVAPFTFRSLDVGVVLDLMIHDLDIVLSLTPGEVTDVEAFGGGLFTTKADLATARLIFAGGAVANLTASRVALNASRKCRLFAPDAYVSIDFGKRYGFVIQKGPAWESGRQGLESLDPGTIPDLKKFVYDGLLSVREIHAQDGEPLRDELSSFLECVRGGREPLVTGAQGRRALAVAFAVEQAMAGHAW